MAYDERLAERMRSILAQEDGVTEKRMFGGLAFLVGGHMACGIVGDELMIRVGPSGHAAAVARPQARVMDFTGRPMRGFVIVKPPGFADRRALTRWLAGALTFVRSLPAKASSTGAARGTKAAPASRRRSVARRTAR